MSHGFMLGLALPVAVQPLVVPEAAVLLQSLSFIRCTLGCIGRALVERVMEVRYRAGSVSSRLGSQHRFTSVFLIAGG
jgi:hypothetical protein